MVLTSTRTAAKNDTYIHSLLQKWYLNPRALLQKMVLTPMRTAAKTVLTPAHTAGKLIFFSQPCTERKKGVCFKN
jgi:hypothetical protein